MSTELLEHSTVTLKDGSEELGREGGSQAAKGANSSNFFALKIKTEKMRKKSSRWGYDM